MMPIAAEPQSLSHVYVSFTRRCVVSPAAVMWVISGRWWEAAPSVSSREGSCQPCLVKFRGVT